MQLSDIKWYLTGGASNTDPKESRGGDRSSTLIASPYAVFDNVNAVENAAPNAYEYRCIVMKNNHSTENLINLSGRIQGTLGSPPLVGFAWEVTDTDEDGDEDAYISKRTTESSQPPSGGALSTFTTSANGGISGLRIPIHASYPDKIWIVPPGGYIRIWLSRIMGNNESSGSKQATITITGDYY